VEIALPNVGTRSYYAQPEKTGPPEANTGLEARCIVTDNPNDAYKAAAAARANRLRGETTATERAKEFPLVAEQN
jgi:hypothetical protein